MWSGTNLTAFLIFTNCPKSAPLKGFRRFFFSGTEWEIYAPKSSAIPTSLHPDIHFSAMIPRRAVKIKFFLSVVIYVVKGDFMPLSAIVESPANAGVARLCGVSFCHAPDTATALPKQARYQLRYTPIYLIFLLCYFCEAQHNSPLRFPQKHSRTARLERVALLVVFSPQSFAWIVRRTRRTSSPNCATPRYIWFFTLLFLRNTA